MHQSRVCLCPDNFPAGYYWYGGKQKGPGHPPKWVEKFLSSQGQATDATQTDDSIEEAPQSLKMKQNVVDGGGDMGDGDMVVFASERLPKWRVSRMVTRMSTTLMMIS